LLFRSVEAEVIVLRDWADMEAKKDQIKGKIVCFNIEWVDYGTSAGYRIDGGSKVSKYGAVAMLIRSLTPFSISSIHTGSMDYDPEYPKIPCAAITV
jgi:carboxypeptidase Q